MRTGYLFSQIVDKVGKMKAVENFFRQGAAESQLVSDLEDRDPAGLKPATQYEGVYLRPQRTGYLFSFIFASI